MSEPLKLDGYIRVSKIGGRSGDGFIAPDVQREQIQAWATLMGAEIIAWHDDRDYGGGNTDRPGFLEAVQRVTDRQTGGIVVARIDRFARNAADGGRVVQEIIKHGGIFASAGERIDPTTEFGKFGLTVMFAMAELELAKIRTGWSIATERAISRGIHTHVPFGYQRAADRTLTPDPATAPLVRGVFEQRVEGASWAALARYLDEHCTPARGKKWTRRSAETIIRNRAYLGEARYGNHVNPDAHPPLVTLELWEAAQIARAPRPARGTPALLSGLVRCAGCRHRMRAATVGERRQRVYRCNRAHGEGTCPSPASVREDALDEYVTGLFLEKYGPVSVRGAAANTSLAAAIEAQAQAEAELVDYRDNVSIRETLLKLGPGHYEAGMEAKVAKVTAANAAVERARIEAGVVDLEISDEVWETLTISERRRLLTDGIDAVFLRRAGRVGRPAVLSEDRAKVLWRGEAPDGLPGPGLRVELRGFDW